MRKLGLSLSAVLGALLGAFIVAWRIFVGYLAAPAQAAPVGPAVIEVSGDLGIEGLAVLLERRGVVAKSDWFQVYLRHFRRDARITPGEYALSPNMSPAEIMDRLSRGAVVTYPIAVAPCARARDVARMIAESKLAGESEVRRLLEDRNAAAKLEVPGPSFEGYLFPDSYSFARGLTPEQILRIMVSRYKQQVTPDLIEAGRQHGLGEHQLITLASLLQAAAVPERQRPQLSALYHNRIRAGIRLEDTASLAYALGKPVEELTQDDEEVDSPFNTFQNPGLPPTPICSPTLEAIKSAAFPADTDALYSASRGDGSYEFCPDEECHRAVLQRLGQTPREPKKHKKKKRERREPPSD